MHCFNEDYIIRDIPEFPNYQISEIGQVYNKITGLELKSHEKKDGYMLVALRNDEGKKYRYIHRLVMKAFTYNVDNKTHVDHIYGNRKNNRLENLRY